jgi:hypothetical protein
MLMWGEGGKGTSWINVAPGMAVEVEYEKSAYHLTISDDDELPAKLTGNVRITRGKIWDADCVIDPVSGLERD